LENGVRLPFDKRAVGRQTSGRPKGPSPSQGDRALRGLKQNKKSMMRRSSQRFENISRGDSPAAVSPVSPSKADAPKAGYGDSGSAASILTTPGRRCSADPV